MREYTSLERIPILIALAHEIPLQFNRRHDSAGWVDNKTAAGEMLNLNFHDYDWRIKPGHESDLARFYSPQGEFQDPSNDSRMFCADMLKTGVSTISISKAFAERIDEIDRRERLQHSALHARVTDLSRSVEFLIGLARKEAEWAERLPKLQEFINEKLSEKDGDPVAQPFYPDRSDSTMPHVDAAIQKLDRRVSALEDLHIKMHSDLKLSSKEFHQHWRNLAKEFNDFIGKFKTELL